MNIKSFLQIGLAVFATHTMFAQANILNAKIPEEIGVKTEAQLLLDNDRPLEYGYVGDRDILFSKMIWEKVVLDERVNFPLYFPIEENLGDDRKSLYQVLLNNMKDGMISKVYADSYFTEERTMKDLEASLTMTKITDAGIDYMNENAVGEAEIPEEYIIRREIGPSDINSYLIKGLWYFDKRQGELKYRILGIAPAAPDVNFIDSEDNANSEPFN